METKWFVIFILGVSWAGKATQVNLLLEKNPTLFHQVLSWKTRPLRPGEENGVDYHYIDNDVFLQWVENNEFLEYAKVHDSYYYGTKKEDLEDAINAWWIVVKEINIQWLEKIQESDPDFFEQTFRIFLDIPDETMVQRILSRAPASGEEIQKRLTSAKIEREVAESLSSAVIDAQPPIDIVYSAVRQVIQSFCDTKGMYVHIQ